MDKPLADVAAATAPRAVLFDAYGTLFDVYSVALLAEQLFPGFGERLSVLWRDKQIDYTRLCSMSGQYRPFWELTRAGLRFAMKRLGLEMDATSEDRLMNQYRHLSSFPENREVLQARLYLNRRFSVDLRPTVALMLDDWNRTKLFPKAYTVLPDDGMVGICAEQCYDFEAGVTREQLKYTVGVWIDTLLRFAQWVEDQV